MTEHRFDLVSVIVHSFRLGPRIVVLIQDVRVIEYRQIIRVTPLLEISPVVGLAMFGLIQPDSAIVGAE
ncbi:MAG: hypothetical protein R3F24_07970 [Gammaproteobacteria bacterium]